MALLRPSITCQVLAVTALGAALRLVGVHQSIWHDEANSIMLARLPFGQMLSALPRLEASPPVYYVLLWGWEHLFGSGVTTARLLGVLIGIPLAPVMYLAAVRLTDSHRAGMVAATVAACSPLMVWYAQEVRPYGLLALLTAITFVAFLELVRREPSGTNWRLVGIWALACAAALETHFYAIFTIVPQAAWLLLHHRRRVDVLAGVTFIALCGLTLIPMLETETSSLGFNYITAVPRSTRLAQILPQFLVGVSSPASAPLVLVCLLIAIAAIWLLLRRGTPREQRSGTTMALFTAGGLALAMLVALFRDSLLTRNVIGLWIPAALVIALGLGGLRSRRVGVWLTLILGAVGIAIVVAVAATPGLQRADWASVARIIRSKPVAGRRDPGRRLVVLENWRVLSPLQLYIGELRPLSLPAAGVAMRDVAEVDLVRALQSAPAGRPPCWWGTPCLPFSSPVPDPSRIPGFRVFEQRRVQEFIVTRLRPLGHPRPVSTGALAAAFPGLSPSASSYLYAPSLTG